MFKKIAKTTTIATALAASVLVSVGATTASAGGGYHGPKKHHGHHWKHGHRWYPGVFVGPFYSGPRYGAPVYYRPAPWTPQWYRYCSSKYRSFNPNTGYFVTYSGHRKFCR
ncbi:BA14K family protein [uncultured Roseibium sp.]|uniref:BA14K family protein n=1 Tax=uncultured Roseibium sp. TaxID=1936171 RepID=UPI00321630C2